VNLGTTATTGNIAVGGSQVGGTITVGGTSQTGAITLQSGNATGTTTTSAFALLANALTSGTGLYVANSLSGQTSDTLINVSQTGVTTGYTGNLVNVSSSSTTGAATFLSVVANASTVGTGEAISMTAATTGIGLKVTAAQATLTGIGRYFSANDGSVEVFGIGPNGHLHSLASAAAPSAAITAANGITAAAIVAGSSDTAGGFTTTGTQAGGTDSTLTVTFGKTYTTAPKAIMLTPASATAVAGGCLAYISSVSATAFVVGVKTVGTCGATPAWNYMVIQ